MARSVLLLPVVVVPLLLVQSYALPTDAARCTEASSRMDLLCCVVQRRRRASTDHSSEPHSRDLMTTPSLRLVWPRDALASPSARRNRSESIRVQSRRALEPPDASRWEFQKRAGGK